jgi:hypothetical protein
MFQMGYTKSEQYWSRILVCLLSHCHHHQQHPHHDDGENKFERDEKKNGEKNNKFSSNIFSAVAPFIHRIVVFPK